MNCNDKDYKDIFDDAVGWCYLRIDLIFLGILRRNKVRVKRVRK